VSVLVCTDGSKGTWDAAQDPHELVAGPAERDAVASVVRRLRPDVVLGHDPWKRYRIHPDHREAGRLACESIVEARDPLFLRGDPSPPWRPSSLLLFEADEVDHLEPADERWLGVKLAALMEHRSQFRSTHGIDDPEDAAQVEAFRRRVAACTLPAERFHLVGDL
jgi:LmbE family N-acetylglucosaminyl deacetylase